MVAESQDLVQEGRKVREGGRETRKSGLGPVGRVFFAALAFYLIGSQVDPVVSGELGLSNALSVGNSYSESYWVPVGQDTGNLDTLDVEVESSSQVFLPQVERNILNLDTLDVEVESSSQVFLPQVERNIFVQDKEATLRAFAVFGRGLDSADKLKEEDVVRVDNFLGAIEKNEDLIREIFVLTAEAQVFFDNFMVSSGLSSEDFDDGKFPVYEISREQTLLLPERLDDPNYLGSVSGFSGAANPESPDKFIQIYASWDNRGLLTDPFHTLSLVRTLIHERAMHSVWERQSTVSSKLPLDWRHHAFDFGGWMVSELVAQKIGVKNFFEPNPRIVYFLWELKESGANWRWAEAVFISAENADVLLSGYWDEQVVEKGKSDDTFEDLMEMPEYKVREKFDYDEAMDFFRVELGLK